MYNTKSHVQDFGIEDAYRFLLLFWFWGVFLFVLLFILFLLLGCFLNYFLITCFTVPIISVHIIFFTLFYFAKKQRFLDHLFIQNLNLKYQTKTWIVPQWSLAYTFQVYYRHHLLPWNRLWSSPSLKTVTIPGSFPKQMHIIWLLSHWASHTLYLWLKYFVAHFS